MSDAVELVARFKPQRCQPMDACELGIMQVDSGPVPPGRYLVWWLPPELGNHPVLFARIEDDGLHGIEPIELTGWTRPQ